MSAPAIQLVGDKALQAKLRELRKAAQNRIMRPAINAGLTPILTQARATAPSTEIRKLLKKRVAKGRGGSVIGMVRVTESTRMVEYQGRQVPFDLVAMVLEFGSDKMNIRARRYLRDARDQQGQAALRIVAQKAEERLDIEWKKRTATELLG